jgi:hypothetical protein
MAKEAVVVKKKNNNTGIFSLCYYSHKILPIILIPSLLRIMVLAHLLHMIHGILT